MKKSEIVVQTGEAKKELPKQTIILKIIEKSKNILKGDKTQKLYTCREAEEKITGIQYPNQVQKKYSWVKQNHLTPNTISQEGIDKTSKSMSPEECAENLERGDHNSENTRKQDASVMCEEAFEKSRILAGEISRSMANQDKQAPAIIKQITKEKQQKKKKKLRTSFKQLGVCPLIPEQLVFLLKGNVLLELNRNADDQDYVPIGFKTNPQNKWKPIQRVIEHNKHGCIEIQVDNLFKPEEDFTFIIKILNSYGEQKYRNIALSLEKYQKIIQGTKELEIHMASQSQTQIDNKEDKTKNINSPEYERAFYQQFYERAMDVLGSMNKGNDKIIFGFTMGKFDKFGFFQDMYNFGVNTNFLWLLGSEMNSMSNIFMRNGWLEIFDQETRIQNSLNFVTLINKEFEAQQAKLSSNQQQYTKEPSKVEASSSLEENLSESIDIVVNSFDQIKIPAKLKIHDIKVKQFGIRITVIDVSPTMIQQVHSIREQQINNKNQVNYIQMFDRQLTYTSESQAFLEKFYPHHQQLRNLPDSFDVSLLPSVRSSIEKMRCNFRLIPNV